MESEGREGEHELEDRVGARKDKREEGASSPFYSESGIPGCCQVTVGQSLEAVLVLCFINQAGFQLTEICLSLLPRCCD